LNSQWQNRGVGGSWKGGGCLQTRHGLIFGVVISTPPNTEDASFYLGFF